MRDLGLETNNGFISLGFRKYSLLSSDAIIDIVVLAKAIGKP